MVGIAGPPPVADKTHRKLRAPRSSEARSSGRESGASGILVFFRERANRPGSLRSALAMAALVPSLGLMTACSGEDNEKFELMPTAREIGLEPKTRIEIDNPAGFPAPIRVSLPRGWHAPSLELRRWPEHDDATCVEITVDASHWDDRLLPSQIPLVGPELHYPSTGTRAYVVTRPQSLGRAGKAVRINGECNREENGPGTRERVEIVQLGTEPVVGPDAPELGVLQAVMVWNPPEPAYVEVNYAADYNAPMRVPVDGVWFTGSIANVRTTSLAEQSETTCVDISLPQPSADPIRRHFEIQRNAPVTPRSEPCPITGTSLIRETPIRSLP